MSNTAHDRLTHVADRFLGKDTSELTGQERVILQQAIDKRAVSRDPAAAFDDNLSLGQRMADAVACFGGSWAFISGFAVALVLWTGGNLVLAGAAFDPYPFIFLNLVLSMLAAIQAPIIMMSQNRQAAKDRDVSAHDYEVNLKAEIEIMALHEKVDRLRDEDIRGLIVTQQAQIDRLSRLVEKQLASGAGTGESQ